MYPTAEAGKGDRRKGLISLDGTIQRARFHRAHLFSATLPSARLSGTRLPRFFFAMRVTSTFLVPPSHAFRRGNQDKTDIPIKILTHVFAATTALPCSSDGLLLNDECRTSCKNPGEGVFLSPHVSNALGV